MRIQLILASLLFSAFAFSSDEKFNALFQKYQLIMESHQHQHVDEVFTEKFLRDSGGKKKFVENLKSMPKTKKKDLKPFALKWKKGTKDEIYFIKIKDEYRRYGSTFIVKEENGKPKIDGTISDD